MRKAALGLAIIGLLIGPGARVHALSKDIIETTGTGNPDPKISNVTQRRAGARNAAIVQARYKMLSIVEDNQVVKGAQVIKTKWADDDSCTVTLRLDKEQPPAQ